MTDANCLWGLSNLGPDTLLVWLEPWADEIAVPVRSTVILKSSGASDERALGEVEWTPDHLVVWARASTVEVFLDGAVQESSSAIIPVPDGLTKEMLSIVFSGQPAARLGGAPNALERTSWWQRIGRRFGL